VQVLHEETFFTLPYCEGRVKCSEGTLWQPTQHFKLRIRLFLTIPDGHDSLSVRPIRNAVERTRNRQPTVCRSRNYQLTELWTSPQRPKDIPLTLTCASRMHFKHLQLLTRVYTYSLHALRMRHCGYSFADVTCSAKQRSATRNCTGTPCWTGRGGLVVATTHTPCPCQLGASRPTVRISIRDDEKSHLQRRPCPRDRESRHT